MTNNVMDILERLEVFRKARRGAWDANEASDLARDAKAEIVRLRLMVKEY